MLDLTALTNVSVSACLSSTLVDQCAMSSTHLKIQSTCLISPVEFWSTGDRCYDFQGRSILSVYSMRRCNRIEFYQRCQYIEAVRWASYKASDNGRVSESHLDLALSLKFGVVKGKDIPKNESYTQTEPRV